MFKAITDGLRALSATSAITVSLAVMAQLPDQVQHMPAGVGMEAIVKYAFEQGGALGVLVIVLYFYRRDKNITIEFWKEQNTARDLLVTNATKAQVETAAALRESTIVIHSLKRAIEIQYPERRDPRDEPDRGDREPHRRR